MTHNCRFGDGESVTVVNQSANGVSCKVRAEVVSAMPSIITATTKAVQSGRR